MHIRIGFEVQVVSADTSILLNKRMRFLVDPNAVVLGHLKTFFSVQIKQFFRYGQWKVRCHQRHHTHPGLSLLNSLALTAQPFEERKNKRPNSSHYCAISMPA